MMQLRSGSSPPQAAHVGYAWIGDEGSPTEQDVCTSWAEKGWSQGGFLAVLAE